MNTLIVLQIGISSFFELDNLYQVFVTRNKMLFVDDETEFSQKLSLFDYGLKVINRDSVIEVCLLSDKVLDERTLFVFDMNVKEIKVEVKRTVYQMLSRFFKPLSKWGILVGIRPVKLVHEMLDDDLSLDLIRDVLSDKYFIHPEKVALMTEIALRERPHLVPNDISAISLYLCIPFCPTRCLYCSFPSNDLKQKGKRLPEYLEKLAAETIHAVNHIYRLGKKVDCIYIGGGTPTSIDESQLDALLGMIKSHVNLADVKEYTVEAGRPDTITRKKLEIMKKNGVNRICINPQTMNEQTLVTIGRAHDAKSIVDVMKMAKEIGFKTINMDLIIGLPGETVHHTSDTLDKIIELAPENITIHTLAVKRASRLHEDLDYYELTHDQMVEEMMDDAELKLRKHGLTPYYMYRQKKMVGHLENVGYAISGHESLYNMRIMEEKHSIVACGAGAVSKICAPEENRFERVANFKGLEDYLDRFDEILLKKEILE
ncbi:MAG TPA: coproporphyrinogen dehydrogenase HemZ [Clostridiales bacterium UBA8960]|nr:coproporphyrinogen dehydrogenase HemZ [Clostridiales bacterium UBA8960]